MLRVAAATQRAPSNPEVRFAFISIPLIAVVNEVMN
jgi:hypothetical protein